MSVLFVRDEEGGEAYREAAGGHAVFTPVQDIHYIEADIPAGYDVIVATSVHGVIGLARLSGDRSTPIICVGEQTAERAAAEGYETIYIGEGRGVNLLPLIEDLYPDHAALIFYARGEQIAFDMAAALKDRGYNPIQRVVYCAAPRRDLPEEALMALKAGQVSAVVFFSARTASLFADICEKAKVSGQLTQTKALCLGDGMLESVKRLPFAAVYSAVPSSRAALIALIKEQLS